MTSENELPGQPINQAADEGAVKLIPLMKFMTSENLKKGGEPPPYQDVENIRQDALIEFLLRMRSGKVQNPKAYLYELSRGVCADALKDFSEYRRRFGTSLSSEVGGGVDGEGGGETLLDQVVDIDWTDQDCDTLRSFLEQRKRRHDLRLVLAGEPTAAFWKFKSQGKTCAEIAAKAGKTPGQVRGQMTRAAKRLRQKLCKMGYDEKGRINNFLGGKKDKYK